MRMISIPTFHARANLESVCCRTSVIRRWLTGCAVAAVGCGLFCSSQAMAQSIEDEFSVQRFDPAPGPRNYFSTRGVRTEGHLAWSAGLFVNYANDPFVLRSCAGLTNCDQPNSQPGREQDIKIVENLFTADMLGSLTLIERLQLGLKIPVSIADGLGLTETGLGMESGVSGVGLGDMLLEGKYRLYGERKDPFVVGAGAFVSAPLGTATSEGNYIGDSTPTGGIRGIFDGEQGQFSFGGNLTGFFRGSGRVGSTELGHELRYSVGAGYKPSPVVRVLLDGFGSTKFSGKSGTNALEIDGGLRITPIASSAAITIGVGTGLVQGVGVPRVRGILGFMWIAEAKDQDGDGIEDNSDQCPTEAEDFDGFEDGDGCPDRDNDGDTIADVDDRCPNEPEDFDGFEDTDGCPELDNDGDGIEDDHDACPNEPETKNGYRDDDGCPDEADRDNDGVPDVRDQCPDEPEDTDGFQDTDGCPDPDNDGDGIPDQVDECVDEPETKNGFEDEDGCPDEAPAP